LVFHLEKLRGPHGGDSFADFLVEFLPQIEASLDGPNATPLLTRTDPPPSTPIKPTPVAETGSIQ